jgi:UDP-GlcNAc:undecaprenyl-phosphate GlcNAc-1-phosphate transferase
MNNLIIRHVLAGGFSFLLTYYLVPIITRAAFRFGILDVPDGKIKCHTKPVPYLGGIAIYAGFVVTLGLTYPFENTLLWLLLGTTMLLLTGLVDDLKVLKPGQKLIGQLLAVLCFLKGGFSLKTTFLSSYVNMALSGFWMLSVINAFNLVDVMDGLSSLIALVATSAFLVIAFLSGTFVVSLLLVIFGGAIGAFLVYNKPPAQIYLGDAGSLFIGGFLAAIPLLLPWSDAVFDVHYTPAVILAVPLLEVFFLIVIRTQLGIPFYKGSPHHFSLYLQRKGWHKWQVLVFTALMGIVFAALGIIHFMKIVSFIQTIAIGCFVFIVWCGIVFTRFLSGRQLKSMRCKR